MENCQEFSWKLKVSAEIGLRQKTPAPDRVNQTLDHLDTWHTYTDGANQFFHSEKPTPYRPLGS